MKWQLKSINPWCLIIEFLIFIYLHIFFSFLNDIRFAFLDNNVFLAHFDVSFAELLRLQKLLFMQLRTEYTIFEDLSPKDISLWRFCRRGSDWKLNEKWVFRSVGWRLVERVGVIGQFFQCFNVIIKLNCSRNFVLVQGSFYCLHIYSPRRVHAREGRFLYLHSSLRLSHYHDVLIVVV